MRQVAGGRGVGEGGGLKSAVGDEEIARVQRFFPTLHEPPPHLPPAQPNGSDSSSSSRSGALDEVGSSGAGEVIGVAGSRSSSGGGANVAGNSGEVVPVCIDGDAGGGEAASLAATAQVVLAAQLFADGFSV